MNTPDACIVLTPNTPLYRQFIRTALKTRDTHALEALKRHPGRPIHFVTNWFTYALMSCDQPPAEAVVIYAPQTRVDWAKAQSTGSDENEAQPEIATVALDTYPFLT
jgi:hypothetical protein